MAVLNVCINLMFTQKQMLWEGTKKGNILFGSGCPVSPMCFAMTILKVVTSTLGVLSGENRDRVLQVCTAKNERSMGSELAL